MLERIHQKLFKFGADRSGVIAIITALLMVVLIVLAGAAIDFGRAINTKRAMSRALDNAALAVASQLTKTKISEDDAKDTLVSLFNSNMRRASYADVKIIFDVSNITINQKTSRINAVASAEVPTSFIRLLQVWSEDDSFSNLDVGSSTEVGYGTKEIEIAMVLDLTDSMNYGTRLKELKTASEGFINYFFPTEDTAKYNAMISLIPYSEGTAINLDDTNISYEETEVEKKGGNKKKKVKFETPVFNGFENSTVNKKPYNNHFCMTNRIRKKGNEFRRQPYIPDDYMLSEDKKNKVLKIYAGTNDCPYYSPLVPLTNDKSKLIGAISKFKTRGTTNGMAAISWGMYALSPEWNDFWKESKAKKYDDGSNQKFLLLMTDGQFNTGFENIKYGHGKYKWDSNERFNSTLNSKYSLAYCNELKKKGVVIAAVFMTSGQDVSNTQTGKILRKCVTSKEYFKVAKSGKLNSIFQEFAKKFDNIVIAK
ncbi:pilus assembly protein [Polycladidibacter stylochi]|uniref:pilus assembly protein n=1 Tax=Polycladidibacter stylochi TaxID=1807766 RepID=UPI0008315A83|nr:pilus assembly protein [Pseudovibrio stylochi]